MGPIRQTPKNAGRVEQLDSARLGFEPSNNGGFSGAIPKNQGNRPYGSSRKPSRCGNLMSNKSQLSSKGVGSEGPVPKGTKETETTKGAAGRQVGLAVGGVAGVAGGWRGSRCFGRTCRIRAR